MNENLKEAISKLVFDMWLKYKGSIGEAEELVYRALTTNAVISEIHDTVAALVEEDHEEEMSREVDT